MTRNTSTVRIPTRTKITRKFLSPPGKDKKNTFVATATVGERTGLATFKATEAFAEKQTTYNITC